MRIRDPGIFLTRDPGWKKIRIRDKHPGSAILYCKDLALRLKWFCNSPYVGSK
jgi:hypothetical protein